MKEKFPYSLMLDEIDRPSRLRTSKRANQASRKFQALGG